MGPANVEVDDRLAVVTINRPEVHNALSRHVLADLRAALGIDIGHHAKLARHATSNDPRDLPGRTVAALVERGELGRTTGTGFYTYDDQGRRHSRPDHETDT